jgi:hypothetical protein
MLSLSLKESQSSSLLVSHSAAPCARASRVLSALVPRVFEFRFLVDLEAQK